MWFVLASCVSTLSGVDILNLEMKKSLRHSWESLVFTQSPASPASSYWRFKTRLSWLRHLWLSDCELLWCPALSLVLNQISSLVCLNQQWGSVTEVMASWEVSLLTPPSWFRATERENSESALVCRDLDSGQKEKKTQKSILSFCRTLNWVLEPGSTGSLVSLWLA